MTQKTSRFSSFWLVLTLILLFAASIRIMAVDYALPYIVNPDEPNVYRLVEGYRGVLDAGWRAEWLAGYPPGYMALYQVIVEGMDRLHTFDVHQDMGKVIGMMRIFNSLIDMLTMALVIYLARHLAGWRAGLLAAGVFAVSTPFVQNASIALRDPLFAMTTLACVVCGLRAWRRDSVWWALLSTFIGLIAVAVKYPAAPVLILPALFFLRYLYQKRAAALPLSALALLMVLGTAYYLWFAYGGGNLSNFEGNQARNFFVQNSLNATRWFNVIKAVLGTLGIGLAIGTIVALVRRRTTPDILLIGLTGVAVLAITPGYLAELSSTNYPVRYILPATAIFIPVAAALVTQLMRRWSNAVQLVIGLLCVAVLVPDLVSYALPLRLTNPYTEGQRWFEANIPDNSVIWMESLDPFKSLSRYDKGYRGYKSFVGLYAPDYSNVTPEDHDRVQYLYLTAEDEKKWPLSKGWEPLDEFTKIKTIGGPNYNPPALSVYAMYTLPESRDTVFTRGNERLILRNLSIETENQGFVESFWQADAAQPSRDYSYSLYITPANEPSNVLAQHDDALGERPTSTWNDPTELVPATIGPIDVSSLAEGEYTLWLVIYDSQSGERFTLGDGSTALQLHTWTIE
jgi:hypothetical protein